MTEAIEQMEPGAPSSRLLFCLLCEAGDLARRELILAPMLKKVFSPDDGFGGILARLLARKLANPDVPASVLEELLIDIHSRCPGLSDAAALDVEATLRRDPASERAIAVVLNQKGFHAIQAYRVAHQLWMEERKDLASYLQSLSSCAFGVDIHPASKIGHSTMLDHATGIVIGETCVIQNDVSIMQGVTLGGTGKTTGDRHPKIGNGVLIGAGAVLLGNIKVGERAKIGASSVVLADVAPYTTVVGVPAQVVGLANTPNPAEAMDQSISLVPSLFHSPLHQPSTGASQ